MPESRAAPAAEFAEAVEELKQRQDIKARRFHFTRRDGTFGPLVGAPFDVAKFLARPLVGRIALAGPVIRPFWYVWEEECFWKLTGAWSILDERLRADPNFELVIDTCDLDTGETRQVIAHGKAYVVDFDVERGRRILSRYAGPYEDDWDPRFQLRPDPSVYGTRLAKMVPDDMWAVELSFRPAWPDRPINWR
ncbi:MAG TPA: pyridoxamine 5'-phosphate oxidase family protein [Actinophytocola sp.]|uniref:pyridoxamine 5'-phosphate oxidase family protein n=1 Tax=Actinophytocola sp. TaxID=1872138 RepID=UPI002DBEB5E8|nr:pyridoxamine 5'-phosphate oxidase family protein [Actinophytocola sp.]HEU5472938.1 pyridoxamine 5'-phosphate oxidase family protein [Actinophytocola sp.]